MYLEIDEGFPEHAKTIQLCAAMGNPLAFGHLLHFWKWACRCCKTGDLRGLSPYVIEEAAHYPQHDGKLYAAMVAKLGGKAGFIDVDESGNPLTIHNWMKRTGAAIARMEASAQRKRDYRASKPWDVLRLEILQRDKNTCVACGAKPSDLSTVDVHHKVPLRRFEDKVAGNSPANLVTLCESCHAKAEKEHRDGEAASPVRNADAARTPRGTVDTVQTSPDQSRPVKSRSGDDQDACSDPSPPKASEPVLVFPCDGQPSAWGLTQEQIDEWRQLYPSLDVSGEARAALAWVKASPDRRKTARGMARFLVGWLSRSQNTRRGQTASLPGIEARVGHARAEDCTHEKRGEIPL